MTCAIKIWIQFEDQVDSFSLEDLYSFLCSLHTTLPLSEWEFIVDH